MISMSVWRRDLSDGSVAVAFYNEDDHDVVDRSGRPRGFVQL